MLFFPDMPQTSRYGQGIAGYDAGSGKQTQRGAFHQEAKAAELCLKLQGAGRVTRSWGAAFDHLILKGSLGCSLFTNTGDTETTTQLSANTYVKSFVERQIESGPAIISIPASWKWPRWNMRQTMFLCVGRTHPTQLHSTVALIKTWIGMFFLNVGPVLMKQRSKTVQVQFIR